MKQSTLNIFMQVYNQLQQIAAFLYEAAQFCAEIRDYDDASLLEARANRIFEEADNLDILISELEE